MALSPTDCNCCVSSTPPDRSEQSERCEAWAFITIVLAVAEGVARHDDALPPRAVPRVITHAVVLSSLGVIVADWGFSQLLLLREEVDLFNA